MRLRLSLRRRELRAGRVLPSLLAEKVVKRSVGGGEEEERPGATSSIWPCLGLARTGGARTVWGNSHNHHRRFPRTSPVTAVAWASHPGSHRRQAQARRLPQTSRRAEQSATPATAPATRTLPAWTARSSRLLGRAGSKAASAQRRTSSTWTSALLLGCVVCCASQASVS